MKQFIVGLVLLLATPLFAQQPGQPPATAPPQSTPPTFPSGRQAPSQPMPPDQEEPADGLSPTEAEQQIRQALDAESALRDSNIDVHVNDTSVILSGGVTSEDQHVLALRIAQSYAGEREIVDHIKLKQQT